MRDMKIGKFSGDPSIDDLKPKKGRGWHGDSLRHSIAQQLRKTKRRKEKK